MYALERVGRDLIHLALPGPWEAGRPWGDPTNVWILDPDTEPVVVDTGHRVARAGLREALAHAGVDPRDVAKVLLTSLRPEAAGNAGVFPHATVHVCDPTGVGGGLRAHWRSLADAAFAPAEAASAAEFAAPGWTAERVDTARSAWLGDAAAGEALPLVAVDDAARVRAGAIELEAWSTPGADVAGTSWFEPRRRWLFSGDVLAVRVDPICIDLGALTTSIGRLVPMAPALVLPARGMRESSAPVVFRSVSLFWNNLLSNLQYVMRGEVSPLELAHADLGHAPSDVMAFSARADRLRLVLDELVRGGVATREGSGVAARYRLGAPATRP
jgi:glyoxylase-like metal-dependent hydrolase (beta-lactamase superfamily II)